MSAIETSEGADQSAFARRADRIELAIRELEERFGPGIVYRLRQARPKLGARAVSTTSLGLDYATGIGGVPRGSLSVFDGTDSSGKSTLGQHVLASAQRDGGLAAYIDADQSVDARELQLCGVAVADLILGQPLSALEALDTAEVLARSAALDAIVVSPLQRPCPPRQLADACRRLAGSVAGTPTALVLVGLREVSPRDPIPASASLAIRFELSRLLFAPGGDVVGFRARAEVVKNRLAPMGRSAEMDVIDGRGLGHAAELLDLGLRLGLVEKTLGGAVFAGQLIGPSRSRAIAWLERDRELAGALEWAIRRELDLDGVSP